MRRVSVWLGLWSFVVATWMPASVWAEPRLSFVPPPDTALARALSAALSAHATLTGPDALPAAPSDPEPARRAAEAVALAEAMYGEARPEDALAVIRAALESETEALAAAGDVGSLGRLVLWQAIALAKTGREADAREAFRAALSLGASTPDPLRFPPDVIALVPSAEPPVPTEIESLPAGASVEVLGATAQQGTTPARFELPPGRYVLRVRRAGSVPIARVVEAGGRIEVPLRPASDAELPGSLAVLRDAGVLDLADPGVRALLARALGAEGRVDARVVGSRLELARFDRSGHRVARAAGASAEVESLVAALFRGAPDEDGPPPGGSTSTSVFGRWWFWTAVGVVVAGAVTVGLIVANQEPNTITYRPAP